MLYMCCQQVGAQNAGKSSLINAMKRAVRHGKPRNELTTAALPGTTLGTAHLTHRCCTIQPSLALPSLQFVRLMQLAHCRSWGLLRLLLSCCCACVQVC